MGIYNLKRSIKLRDELEEMGMFAPGREAAHSYGMQRQWGL
ncbi:MAG: hypothetical protein ACLUD2_04120 [Clostridium sp.]